MARFQYRLQKVYELRERKKKQQEQRVIDARKKVQEVQNHIEETKQEIRSVRQSMLQSSHMLMASHDDYIHKRNHDLDRLYEDLALAEERLAYEKQLLIKAQADLEALIKHKEKSREEWLEEQRVIEAKQMDEVAGQRYFRAQLEQAQDEIEEMESH